MRHLRWLLVPLVVVPLAWLLFTGFSHDPREVNSPLIGRPAPVWGLPTLDGGRLTTDDLAGRPYIVNFWASWCIPACVDEQPVLAEAHETYPELAVVGVLYQDLPTDAEAFLALYGDAGYPHLIDDGGWLGIDFGVTGPPETFFVDADGIVRAKQFGPLTDATMAELLSTILPAAGR